MYKRFVNIVIFIFILTIAFAQNPQKKPCTISKHQWQQQMTEKKRLYFIEKMNLTETETVAFTTLFNKYEDDMRASHHKVFLASKKCEEKQNDESYNNFLNTITNEKKYQGEREAEFINSLKKIMSVEKAYKYCDAERDFKMLMMKEVAPAPKIQK